MVQFGFDDAEYPEEQQLQQQQDKPIKANGLIDPTRRSSVLQIPGSFVFDSPERRQNYALSQPGAIKHDIIGDGVHTYAASDCSMQEDDEVLRKNDDTSLAAGRLSECSQNNVSHETLDSYPDSAESHAVASVHICDWPVQMQNLHGRYKLLQSSERMFGHGKRKQAGLDIDSPRYTAHDLDLDLFGRPLQPNPFQTHLRSIQSSARGACPLPGPFAFRWDNRGLLVSSNRTIDFVQVDSFNLAAPEAFRRECFEYLLGQSDVVTDPRGTPRAVVRQEFQAQGVISNNMTQTERSVWHLASSLFDPCDTDFDFQDDFARKEHMVDKIRKQSVSNWLQTATLNAVRTDERQASNKSEIILAKLTGFQIAEACAIALSNGDFRLATILPLAGGDTSTKTDIRNQVKFWHDRQDREHIEDVYLQIYEMITGDIKCNTTLGRARAKWTLDWKRLFGVFLWYKAESDYSLKAIITEFLQSEQYLALSQTDSSVKNDVHLYLLRTFATITHEQESLSRSAVIDRDPPNSLAWCLHLYLFRRSTDDAAMHLSSSDVERMNLRFDQDTIELAMALEASGQWKWGLLVLLYINDSKAREGIIKRHLARLSFPLSISSEHFILSELKLPMLWLIEATALSLRNEASHVQECRCLLDATLWNEAHSTLVRYIAPQSIISGYLEDAHDLLSKLAQVKDVQNWDRGGQLYFEAVNLILSTRTQKKTEQSDRKPASKAHQIGKIWNLLNIMYQETFEQRVAKHEISSLLLQIAMSNNKSTEDVPMSNLSSIRSASLVDFQPCS